EGHAPQRMDLLGAHDVRPPELVRMDHRPWVGHDRFRAHVFSFFSGLAISTRARSFRVPSVLYEPVTTSSPSLRPSRISMSVSPRMPVLTGRNTTCSWETTNTPSRSSPTWRTGAADCGWASDAWTAAGSTVRP